MKLDKNYEHHAVNHSINFVYKSDKNIHTQGIECVWGVSKQKFKAMKGCSRIYLQSYLTEFCWRFRFNNRMEIFEELVKIIQKHWDKIYDYDETDKTELEYCDEAEDGYCNEEEYELFDQERNTTRNTTADHELKSSEEEERKKRLRDIEEQKKVAKNK